MEQYIIEVIYCIKQSNMPLKVQEYLINLLNETKKGEINND